MRGGRILRIGFIYSEFRMQFDNTLHFPRKMSGIQLREWTREAERILERLSCHVNHELARVQFNSSQNFHDPPPRCPSTKHLPILDHQFEVPKRVGIDGTYLRTSSIRMNAQVHSLRGAFMVTKFHPMSCDSKSFIQRHHFHSWSGAATTIDKRRNHRADELLLLRDCIHYLFYSLSQENV